MIWWLHLLLKTIVSPWHVLALFYIFDYYNLLYFFVHVYYAHRFIWLIVMLSSFVYVLQEKRWMSLMVYTFILVICFHCSVHTHTHTLKTHVFIDCLLSTRTRTLWLIIFDLVGTGDAPFQVVCSSDISVFLVSFPDFKCGSPFLTMVNCSKHHLGDIFLSR